MKSLKYLLLLSLLLLAIPSFAQKQGADVLYIKSERIVSPLVQKWATQYANENPEIKIEFVKNNDNSKAANLSVVLAENATEAAKSEVIYTGRYALLPVTTASNKYLEDISKFKLNKDRIVGLFFDNDLLQDDVDKKTQKLAQKITIYSGNSKVSAAEVFASHFGLKATDLRGKRIAGDDLFLLKAIEKDTAGVTFNNLAYIYDISTRQLKNNLTILPLDIKKEYQEALNSDNIDQVLTLLEDKDINLIPVEQFGFNVEKSDKAAQGFVKWILSEGQKYNHEFGFLTLDKKILAEQQSQLNELYLTSK